MIRRKGVEFCIATRDESFWVDYTFSPSKPATMYKRNGDPGDPPEYEDIEIIKVTQNGLELTLDMDEEDELEEKISQRENEVEEFVDEERGDR